MPFVFYCKACLQDDPGDLDEALELGAGRQVQAAQNARDGKAS
jgi:hypothetical protein